MTPEIKELMNKNWTIQKISEVGSIITGSTPPTKFKEYFLGKNLFITPSDFTESHYIEDTERHLSDNGAKASRLLPPGTIYVVCIGATVGKIGICKKKASCNQQINAVIPFENVSTDFLYYSIDYVFNRNKRKYVGTQTLPIVNKSTFSNLELCIPPLYIQKQIAEILTTQDRVIELKEKLIAEKQRQKKYLMQQLLTGKKRLPGFNGEWKKVHLRDLAERCIRRNSIGNSNVLTISAQYGLINQEEFFNKSIASDDKSTYFLLNKDDFAYNKSYSNGYPFGAIKRLTRYDAGIVSPLYICFRITLEKTSIEFIEQYFEAGLMNHEIQAFAQEGARNHGLLNISVGDFFNSKVLLPGISEQIAIADILSSADREIELLQQELGQEKQKKKALMQLLLTGIVRV